MQPSPVSTTFHLNVERLILAAKRWKPVVNPQRSADVIFFTWNCCRVLRVEIHHWQSARNGHRVAEVGAPVAIAQPCIVQGIVNPFVRLAPVNNQLRLEACAPQLTIIQFTQAVEKRAEPGVICARRHIGLYKGEVIQAVKRTVDSGFPPTTLHILSHVKNSGELMGHITHNHFHMRVLDFAVVEIIVTLSDIKCEHVKGAHTHQRKHKHKTYLYVLRMLHHLAKIVYPLLL